VCDTAYYFSLSFSLDGDELGQWRAYSDNGRGYAIGFDASSLEQAFSRLGREKHLVFPVSYDENHLSELQERLVDTFVFYLRALPSTHALTAVGRDFLTNMLGSFTSVALHISVLFKNKHYRAEREYRFLQVFGSGPPARIRSKPHSLVTYREFDWRSVAPSSLKLVRVGPAADKSKAKQLAHDCLRVFHTGSVEIDSSPIPYRA
jgi:hypothetical protein